MNSNLYVGNLSFGAKENEISEVFSRFGEVKSVRIITDRETGRSKGFCFVEMSSEAEAESAKEGLDGQEVLGRALKVDIARDKKPAGNGGGFGGARSGGGPRGNGGGFNRR